MKIKKISLIIFFNDYRFNNKIRLKVFHYYSYNSTLTIFRFFLRYYYFVIQPSTLPSHSLEYLKIEKVTIFSTYF